MKINMGHSHHIACKQVLIIEWQNLAKAGKSWQTRLNMGHSHHIACKQVLIIEWQNLAKPGKTWQKLADKTEHGS